MTKDEFAVFLTERGYPAQNEGGVVKISEERPLTKADVKAVRSLIQEAGYNASYGYRAIRQNR